MRVNLKTVIERLCCTLCRMIRLHSWLVLVTVTCVSKQFRKFPPEVSNILLLFSSRLYHLSCTYRSLMNAHAL